MTTNATAGLLLEPGGRPGTENLPLEQTVNHTDPTAAIYDALAGLQGGPHHLPPGTRQAIAEHLAATLPASAVLPEPTSRAAVLLDAADMAEDVALRLRSECLLDQVTGAYEVMTALRRLAAEAQQQPDTEAQAARCPSCDHEAKYHDVDGRCWFTVDHGVPGSNLVCPCAPRRDPDEEQQPADEAPLDEPPTEEQIVREHVTSLHLIGEQLATIESWMWQHLFEVREAQAARATQQPAPSDGDAPRP